MKFLKNQEILLPVGCTDFITSSNSVYLGLKLFESPCVIVDLWNFPEHKRQTTKQVFYASGKNMLSLGCIKSFHDQEAYIELNLHSLFVINWNEAPVVPNVQQFFAEFATIYSGEFGPTRMFLGKSRSGTSWNL